MGNKEIKYEAYTNIGKRRKQEDSMAVSSDNTLFAIADGVGGEENGKLVSQYICNYFTENSAHIFSSESLIQVAIKASKCLSDWAKENGLDKGASTLALLKKVSDGNWVACNVGDSRIYLIDCETQLVINSRDHSFVFEMFENGLITRQDINTHSMRNQITKAYKIGLDLDVGDIRVYNYSSITESHYFLTCTDGLWEIMNESTFKKLMEKKDLKDISDYLNQLIIEQAKDNASYWLVSDGQ